MKFPLDIVFGVGLVVTTPTIIAAPLEAVAADATADDAVGSDLEQRYPAEARNIKKAGEWGVSDEKIREALEGR